MKRILVMLGIFQTLVLVQGTLSFAGDFKNCVQMGKIPHQFNLSTLQNNYEIHVECSHQYGEENQNYEKHSMTFTVSWDGKTKKATEMVDDHFLYFYNGAKQNDTHYKKTIYADCPDDPWLNQVACPSSSISDPFPMDWVFYPPYPISARLLPASERQFLLKEFVALQRKLAPEIKLPKQNGKFSNGQLVFEAKASVPDEDDPSTWDVEIELNMDPSQAAPHNIPLKAVAHMTGLHTAWKYMDLPYNGFWLIRARSKSPKHVSEWSNSVRFEIAGSKGPQLQSIPALKTPTLSTSLTGKVDPPTIKSPAKGQVITGTTVNISVVPPQGSGTSQINLEFEHNNQPLQSAPLWQKVSVLNGYNTASYPSGYPLPKSKFPKTGKWRVRAQVASQNASWCNPVDFELK